MGSVEAAMRIVNLKVWVCFWILKLDRFVGLLESARFWREYQLKFMFKFFGMGEGDGICF